MEKGRRGLRPVPEGGWPLDRVLVGVGTVRTLRELVLEHGKAMGGPRRAWDVALWSGVTAQGSIGCMERLHRAGLVEELPPDRPWRACRYLPVPTHPLWPPLADLFRAERIRSRRRAQVAQR